jgi:serine/threonine-protein kinase
MLDPRHPLLLTSLGYLLFRQGDVPRALATLESVLAEHRDVPIAVPTLALARLAAGERDRALALITEETLTAADADADMAYRLATLFAFDADASAALRWLRKSIYLGNENHPWISRNPAWSRLAQDEDYRQVLAGLETAHRANRRRWAGLLKSRVVARPAPARASAGGDDGLSGVGA